MLDIFRTAIIEYLLLLSNNVTRNVVPSSSAGIFLLLPIAHDIIQVTVIDGRFKTS